MTTRTLPDTIYLCSNCFEEFWIDQGGKCPMAECDQELIAFARQPAPSEQGVRLHERWRYKPNRGSGTFTVVGVQGDRVTLRSNYFGKDKTISLRTLRGDYEKASDA